MRNIIIILCMLALSSCSMGKKTYETFQGNMDRSIGKWTFIQSKSWAKKDYDDISYHYCPNVLSNKFNWLAISQFSGVYSEFVTI